MHKRRIGDVVETDVLVERPKRMRLDPGAPSPSSFQSSVASSAEEDSKSISSSPQTPVESKRTKSSFDAIVNVCIILKDRGLACFPKELLCVIAEYYGETPRISSRQLHVLDLILQGYNVCVLGGGGAGKTYACSYTLDRMRRRVVYGWMSPLLRRLSGRERLVDRVIDYMDFPLARTGVVAGAPTGVAACNIGNGARTLHSLFGLMLDNLTDQRIEYEIRRLKSELASYSRVKKTTDPSPEVVARLAKKPGVNLSAARLFWGDEFSMVRDEFALAMDKMLKGLRGSSRPMGGLQMLVSADWAQISPYPTEAERAAGLKYSRLLFEGEWWKSMKFKVVLLEYNFRQDGSDLFQRVLNAIRLHAKEDPAYGIKYKPLPDFVMEFLKSRSRTTLQVQAWLRQMAFRTKGKGQWVPPLYLTSHNDRNAPASVRHFNSREEGHLKAQIHTFLASTFVIKTVRVPLQGNRGWKTLTFWGYMDPEALSQKELSLARARENDILGPDEVRPLASWKTVYNKLWKDIPERLEVKEGAPIQSCSNADIDQEIGNRKRGIFISKAVESGGEMVPNADKLPVVRLAGTYRLKQKDLQYRPPEEFAVVCMEGEERKSMKYCLRRMEVEPGVELAVFFMPLRYCFAATHDSSQSLTLAEGVVSNVQYAFSPGSAFVSFSRCKRPEDLIIENFDPSQTGPDPEKQTIFGHPSAIKFYQELARRQQQRQ